MWSIEGVVVDERGMPVNDAVVHAREQVDPSGAKTGVDGKFTLWCGSAPLYARELVADAAGGTRLGVARFAFPMLRSYAARDSVRIVIRPARTVTVRVNDAAGAPIPGAAVEAFDYDYQFRAMTGADGRAIVRIPVDARIPGVIGLKSGAGFDYFENYTTNPPTPEFEVSPLPAEITLTLNGAQTVRIKVIDQAGRPIPGIVIKPFRPMKAKKIATIAIAGGAIARAITNQDGVAIFDWLPRSEPADSRASRGVTFFVEPPNGFVAPDPIRYRPGGPSELTVRLGGRLSRLSGTVRFPDGRPAQRILLIASLPSSGWLPAGREPTTMANISSTPLSPGFRECLASLTKTGLGRASSVPSRRTDKTKAASTSRSSRERLFTDASLKGLNTGRRPVRE